MYRLISAENTVPTGNTVANSNVATSFASQAVILAANSDVTANSNRSFRITAFGYYSCQATPGNLTITANLGTFLLGTATITNLPSAGVTNAGWCLTAFMQIVETGSGTSGRVSFQGEMFLNGAHGSGGALMADMINTGSGTSGQITGNTQAAANFLLTVQWATASATNTITMSQLVVEEIT
jgi:hypothetical protein